MSAARRILPSRELVLAWAHLTVLWAFAAVQPLFEVLSDSPEFFVARGNTAADIVVFAVGATVLPPTAAFAVELLVSRWPPVRRAIHLVLVAILAAAIALQALDELLGGDSSFLLPAAIVLGAAGAVAYGTTRVARSMLTVLTPAPLVFLVAFLAFSPVEKLVFPESEAGAADVRVHSKTPVVFVLFDELSLASLMDREHKIDETRFPGFARLARGSTWYRNATTVADQTSEAVPAILTGKTVRDERSLPILSDHPRNLFTLLGRDYSIDATESVTRLCPKRLCRTSPRRQSASDRVRSLVSDLSVVSLHLLLPTDLESDLPPVDQTFGDFRGGRSGRDRTRRGTGTPTRSNRVFENRDRAFAGFLERLGRTTPKPPLHFIHSQLPHMPWEYLPSGQSYLGGKETPGLFFDIWKRGPYAQRALQRYLLQLSYVDRLVGRVLDRLQATGLYRHALVVVMADHGVSFRPGLFRRDVTRETFGDIAGIPLFIKAPGQHEGRIDDRLVRSVDVLPTVAGYLGAAAGWDMDGRSIADRSVVEPGPVTVAKHKEGSVSVAFPEYRARLRGAVDEIVRRFGSHNGTRGVYAEGHDVDLIGRDAPALASRSPARGRAELETPALFASVDLEGGPVPARVEGRLTGRPAGERLAIAVNGRIQALTQSYSEEGAVRFSSILPVSALRAQGNVVEVFLVEGEGKGRRLASLGAPRQAALVRRGGRRVLVLRSGREIQLVPGAISGFVDQVQGGGSTLVVTGWAADTAHRRVPDRVLVFADGRLLVGGAPSVTRPDVARDRGRALLRSGYRLAVTTAGAAKLAESGRIRVVAVAGATASELKPPP